MPVEWVAQTNVLTCANCGKPVNEGQNVVGELDSFYHKEGQDCSK